MDMRDHTDKLTRWVPRAKPLVDSAVERQETPVHRVTVRVEVDLDIALLTDEDGGFPSPHDAILRHVLKAVDPYGFIKPMGLRMGSEVINGWVEPGN